MNLAYKILSTKLKSGELVAGQQIGIQIDQTLTQDSTGTMAYLQLEAMGIEHVAVEKAVAYIDHNMLQTGFENMDDHEFIRSVAKKHGITFSKPGNGVCHQLQLENFAKPGKTLVGSDSHTPTCGAMGMIAIGAGDLRPGDSGYQGWKGKDRYHSVYKRDASKADCGSRKRKYLYFIGRTDSSFSSKCF